MELIAPLFFHKSFQIHEKGMCASSWESKLTNLEKWKVERREAMRTWISGPHPPVHFVAIPVVAVIAIASLGHPKIPPAGPAQDSCLPLAPWSISLLHQFIESAISNKIALIPKSDD